MAVEDVVVRGQMDLWFEEGGELVIVDYKTDAVSAAEAHQRAGDYALQFRLYAMAVEQRGRPAAGPAWLHFPPAGHGGAGEPDAVAAGFAGADRARFSGSAGERRLSAESRKALRPVRLLRTRVRGR